jgi:hypothetical protein
MIFRRPRWLTMGSQATPNPWNLALFLASFGAVLFELSLTRIFAVVMFAQFAHLAISLALLGGAVGALFVYLVPRAVPAERLAERAGALCLAAAVAMVLGAVLSVSIDLTQHVEVFEGGSAFRLRADSFQELTRPAALLVLLPAVALPFACTGAAVAAAFRHLADRIGTLYAADLAGGAFGCAAFLPLLHVVGGPDAVFVAAFATALGGSALLAASGPRSLLAASLVTALLLAALGGAATRGEVIRLGSAAGFSERYVTHVRWTPLARIAVWEPPARFDTFLTLDNTSRSRVVTNADATRRFFERSPTSAALRLLGRPGKVLLLAAGAGSEVVAAHQFGHRDITAVDLFGDVFDVVRTRFAAVPENPYLDESVRRVVLDARSAVRGAEGRYDIIQANQANLMSFGGLVEEAWSPHLLYTQEAIADDLDHLTEDGLVQISAGVGIVSVARSALAALAARGAADPFRNVALMVGSSPIGPRVLLVRPRPFTEGEVEALRELTLQCDYDLALDPGAGASSTGAASVLEAPLFTDDHPYQDTLGSLWTESAEDPTLTHVERTLAWHVALLLALGAVLLGVPYLVRGRREAQAVGRPGRALGYFAALGYGFLGVEIVLVHRLSLFVGHPTYAVTVVLLSLLLGGGAGSLRAARVAEARIARARRASLLAVVVGVGFVALVVCPWLDGHLLGLGLPARIGLSAVAVAPVGFLLGQPLPLGMRLLPREAGALVPWCWAINGWTSVAGAVVTVAVARLAGYRGALAVALCAYALAYVLCGRRAAPAPARGLPA